MAILNDKKHWEFFFWQKMQSILVLCIHLKNGNTSNTLLVMQWLCLDFQSSVMTE